MRDGDGEGKNGDGDGVTVAGVGGGVTKVDGITNGSLTAAMALALGQLVFGSKVLAF